MTNGSRSAAAALLEGEARALLTRLSRLRPFALSESMVPAANVSHPAQRAIEAYLADGRQALRSRVTDFLRWLRGTRDGIDPAVAQRRFTLLRLRFNAVLSQFDIFADVLTQRSETNTGVWLAGLDVASADGLRLAGAYFDPPPLVCYLDRGPGAAIRRARTRLPGGGDNPVAVVMIPRERMIGSGIASSLLHEVGHQAAALLDLVNTVRARLQRRAPAGVWRLWDRWISEILADAWAVGRIGIGAPLGLMAVVSLPRAFVFAVRTDDPHPPPWIRVKASCAIGDAFYPHPQWRGLARVWQTLYPIDGVDPRARAMFAALEATLPELAGLIAGHRPAALRGATLAEVVATPDRHPAALAALIRRHRRPSELATLPPTLALAAIAQARAASAMSPEREAYLLGALLTRWALGQNLGAAPTDVWRTRQPEESFHG